MIYSRPLAIGIFGAFVLISSCGSKGTLGPGELPGQAGFDPSGNWVLTPTQKARAYVVYGTGNNETKDPQRGSEFQVADYKVNELGDIHVDPIGSMGIDQPTSTVFFQGGARPGSRIFTHLNFDGESLWQSSSPLVTGTRDLGNGCMANEAYFEALKFNDSERAEYRVMHEWSFPQILSCRQALSLIPETGGDLGDFWRAAIQTGALDPGNAGNLQSVVIYFVFDGRKSV